MNRFIRLVVAVLVLSTLPGVAQAYIDPGVTYALLQGLFVVVFGGAAAFVLRPWNYVKRLFGASKPAEPETSDPDTSAVHDEPR
jgi:hypothetical protein